MFMVNLSAIVVCQGFQCAQEQQIGLQYHTVPFEGALPRVINFTAREAPTELR